MSILPMFVSQCYTADDNSQIRAVEDFNGKQIPRNDFQIPHKAVSCASYKVI